MANKLVLADAKKADILEGGRPYLDTLEMRLYVNAISLDGTTMPAIGTDEPGDGGYAEVTSPFPNVATLVGTVARAVGVNPTYVFNHDAGDFTIHGVFFTDPGDGDATVMAQEADATFAVVAAGQVYVVEAIFDLDTLA